jgi:hypothetical protein
LVPITAVTSRFAVRLVHSGFGFRRISRLNVDFQHRYRADRRHDVLIFGDMIKAAFCQSCALVRFGHLQFKRRTNSLSCSITTARVLAATNGVGGVFAFGRRHACCRFVNQQQSRVLRQRIPISSHLLCPCDAPDGWSSTSCQANFITHLADAFLTVVRAA